MVERERKSKLSRRACVTFPVMALLFVGALYPTAAVSAACTKPDSSPQPVMSTHAPPPYPMISYVNHEQGMTTLDLVIDASGTVTGAQLEKSSGSDRLDAAAAQFIKANWRWLPATHDCQPVIAPIKVAINWVLPPDTGGMENNILVPPTFNYPADALARGEHGTTVVKLTIPTEGHETVATLGTSSGFADLDAKALELAAAHNWAMALPDGDPVHGTVTVFVLWKLPPGTSMPGTPPN